jgi:hypothetical protein
VSWHDGCFSAWDENILQVTCASCCACSHYYLIGIDVSLSLAVFKPVHTLPAGEGVPLRVELAKPEQLQRGVSFGAVPCGSSCSRTLALVNRGKAAAFVSFEPSMELFDRLQMEVMPAGGMLLKSHEVAEVTIWYRWVCHEHEDCMVRCFTWHAGHAK